MRGERILMPVLDGWMSGTVHEMESGVTSWRVAKATPPKVTNSGYRADSDDVVLTFSETYSEVIYWARRWQAVLPGRTDRQWFWVLLSGQEDQSCYETLIRIWRSGVWSPPDSQSEFWPIGPGGTERERVYMALYLAGQGAR